MMPSAKRNSDSVAVRVTRLSGMMSRYPLALILITIIIATGFVSPKSIYPKNLLMVSKLAAVYGVIGIGQTMAVLTGGVDLSTGAVMTLSLTVGSGLMRGENQSILWVTILLLAVAIVIGLVNAFIIVRTRVHPLIATLATSAVIQGLYLLYTKGAPKGGFPPALRFVGRGNLFGLIPTSLVVWLGLSLIAILVLRETGFGRSVYYVGSNPVAARLSGINSSDRKSVV